MPSPASLKLFSSPGIIATHSHLTMTNDYCCPLSLRPDPPPLSLSEAAEGLFLYVTWADPAISSPPKAGITPDCDPRGRDAGAGERGREREGLGWDVGPPPLGKVMDDTDESKERK